MLFLPFYLKKKVIIMTQSQNPVSQKNVREMMEKNFFQEPKFECVEDERRHCQERLAAAFRLFAHYGFDQGVAGHITVRDPELTDHFWVNPLGMYFGHIRVSDLLLVNHQGEIVKGDRPVNAAAFAIHYI